VGTAPPAATSSPALSAATSLIGGTPPAAAPAVAASGPSSSAADSPYISINKQASVITVYASDHKQKEIRRYLERVRDAVSAQVLIEAKVVEVTLSDEYRTGINWAELDKKAQTGLGMTVNFTKNFAEAGSGNSDMVSLGVLNKIAPGTGSTVNPLNVSGNLSSTAAVTAATAAATSSGSSTTTGTTSTNNMQALVQLMQGFGTARTLSSPRIHAINNQQAVLSFVTNQVYFTIQSNNTSSTSASGSGQNSLSVNSTLNSIPLGIVMTLQPSINLDTKEITMNIRPTITSDTGKTVSDPAASLMSAQLVAAGGTAVSSSVPVIEVKELDSILRIKSGEVMVIGGMMQESSTNYESGLPGIMKAPIIGNLFKGVSKNNDVKQTVIFIKATIVESDGSSITHRDKDLYNTFARDVHL
jgi:general secretion pathway protein D